jgi:hypothetical protein
MAPMWDLSCRIDPGRRPAAAPTRIRERACDEVDLLGQGQDLPREVEQLDVLLVLL